MYLLLVSTQRICTSKWVRRTTTYHQPVEISRYTEPTSAHGNRSFFQILFVRFDFAFLTLTYVSFSSKIFPAIKQTLSAPQLGFVAGGRPWKFSLINMCDTFRKIGDKECFDKSGGKSSEYGGTHGVSSSLSAFLRRAFTTSAI